MSRDERKPYMAEYGKDSRYYVDGPANAGECSYYGGTMYPDYRFDSKEGAELAAKFANIGFEQGYLKAQRDIRKALGLKDN